MPAIKKKFPQNEKERNDWRDFAMKNEIIKNAIELFAKKGYYGCTLDEIAKSVSIKKASLYYYFPSKANIYEECTVRIFNHFNRMLDLQEDASHTSLENLKQFILDVVFKPNISYLRMYLQFTQAPEEFKEQLYVNVAALHKRVIALFKVFYEKNDVSISFSAFEELMFGVIESGFVRTTFINYFDELSYRRETLEGEVSSMLDSLLELNESQIDE